MLGGIVVNNAILLVDQAGKLRIERIIPMKATGPSRLLLLVLVLLLSSPAAGPAQPDSPAAQQGKVLELSVEEVALLVLQNNRDLQVRRLNPVIAGTFEQIERGAFDPEVFAELTHSEEQASETDRATSSQFDVEGSDAAAEAGIRTLLPTGTNIEGKVEQFRSTSNRAREQQVARLGLSVTQALLQGFGPAVNLAAMDPRTKTAPVEDLVERLQLAEKMRPELNEARMRLEQQRLETVVTRNGLLPRLEFFITLGKTGYADSFSGSFDELDEKYLRPAGGRPSEPCPRQPDSRSEAPGRRYFPAAGAGGRRQPAAAGAARCPIEGRRTGESQATDLGDSRDPGPAGKNPVFREGTFRGRRQHHAAGLPGPARPAGQSFCCLVEKSRDLWPILIRVNFMKWKAVRQIFPSSSTNGMALLNTKIKFLIHLNHLYTAAAFAGFLTDGATRAFFTTGTRIFAFGLKCSLLSTKQENRGAIAHAFNLDFCHILTAGTFPRVIGEGVAVAGGTAIAGIHFLTWH